MGTEKTSWPEWVGRSANLAVHQIVTDRPDVAIELVPPNGSVAPGYDAHRVRVYFDDSGNVLYTPVIG